jgi:hypothetical protein
MRMRNVSLLVTLLTCALASNVLAQGDKALTAKLKHKKFKKWSIILPKETFTPANGTIKVPHAGGEGFVTEIDGTALAVDANGDGKVDTKAKGSSGLITLKGKTAEGKSFKYSVRLRNEGGWQWSAGGAMVGKLGGESITLVDQNNNGKYNDFGEDAMIIGKSDAAAFLSKVVSLKGALYNLSVSTDGRELSATPWTGATGRLNVAKDYESKAKLITAVVAAGADGISFDLARAKNGMLLPVGEYRIVSGMVTKGQQSARIKGGDRTYNVTADADISVKWGGPLRAEFDYDVKGDQVTFDPSKVWYYGQAGEEYTTWMPSGLSPKFVLTRKKNARRIREARFGS